MSAHKTAVVFGISGVIGRNLGEHLAVSGDWNVIGVSRHAHDDLPGAAAIACDLTDAGGVRRALQSVEKPTHAFFCTWSRQATETENCRVNGQMVRNALDALAPHGTLQHAALVTGLKHYLGPFDNYATEPVRTPFSEELPRAAGENFYYAQEDALFESAAKNGFNWSVARPHTIIGYGPGAAMNMGTSIAVYATLAKETGIPFVFPGSPQSYNGLVDVTDARVLARHLEWETTEPKAANKAFNVVNGDIFRWRDMWARIANYFGVPAAPYPGHEEPLATRFKDIGGEWSKIVKKHGLLDRPIEKVAPWWHVDIDLCRTIECVTDMGRSRALGFLVYQNSWESFQSLFERLRAEKIIP
jgi:nucleoside-diphosphate-sugar epimerase